MREIKLRAWIKSSKRFLPLDAASKTYLRLNAGGVYCATVEPIDSNMGHVAMDDLVLTQFTGLKDKNGVEIFEGDIVRATKNWPGKGSQAFISTFRDNTAMFAFREAFTNGDGEKYFYDALQVSGIEVTGNIHENPELLEVTS